MIRQGRAEWVRLTSTGLGRQEGCVLDRSQAELVLSSQPQALRISATDIDTLWTRGTSVKTGAITGALIGAALGVGLGVASCGKGDDCGAPEMAPIVGAAGLAGGGLLGALVGLAVPKWHRRFP